jgi:hypothetical protein
MPMPMMRTIRLVGFALGAGALASVAVLWLGVIPARAAARTGICIPLLPSTCPTTTVATTPPTTKAPPTTTATTVPPKTGHPASTVAGTSRTTAPRRTTAAPSVGAAGLPALPAGTGDPLLATGADPSAPQLAGTPAPSSPAVATTSPALSGLVGATKGLPNDHATVRIVLSIGGLLVAALAIAQLPASRRSPRPAGNRAD